MSAALTIETVGALDPFGPEKVQLPSPRTYVATLVVWWVLGLVAGIGPSATRAASALGWLVVLLRLVTPPFGPKVLRSVNRFRLYFSESQGGGTVVQAPNVPEATGALRPR